VLVAVQKEPWFRVLDVIVEGEKTGVNVIIAIMDESGGVVCKKHVDGGKTFHQVFHLTLVEKMVSPRFVFPRTTEPTEGHPSELESFQVEIANRLGEWAATIVIAFDRKNISTAAPRGNSQNGLVCQVTQRKEKVRTAFWNVVHHVFVVRDDEEIHRDSKVTSTLRKATRNG